MLEISNISKTFHPQTPNEVRALQNVSVTIEGGSFVCLLGTNGSGKSTLLNAVAGAFIVDSGKILLDNINITQKKEYERAKLIGRVFQNPFSGTAPEMTIAENIAVAALRGEIRGFGIALNKNFLADCRARIKSLNMGLENRLDNIIGSLSGGQRQALTLLMAAWQKPKLLLLDEHTAALDPKTARIVLELTDKIISKDRLTTMMVTHSMQQAVNLGDRIIMMNKGKIIYDFKGLEKKRLKTGDLLGLFEDMRRKDMIDQSAAEMLEANYI